MKHAIRLLAAPALLLMFAAGCGGGGGANVETLATRAAGATPSASLTVVADNIKFDTDTIVVPAGQPVTLRLDNQDSGTQHNIAVYNDDSASQTIFRGELFSGRDSRQYEFAAPPAGVYYFRCDVHPDMNGVFIAR